VTVVVGGSRSVQARGCDKGPLAVQRFAYALPHITLGQQLRVFLPSSTPFNEACCGISSLDRYLNVTHTTPTACPTCTALVPLCAAAGL
jgi:hypothetical protein